MVEDRDPPSPEGVDDELARKMSSLERTPDGAENPGEVGGDCSGDLVVLGSDVTEEVATIPHSGSTASFHSVCSPFSSDAPPLFSSLF